MNNLQGKQLIAVVILILVFSLALSGCSGGSKEPVDPEGNNTTLPGKVDPTTSNEPTGGTKQPATAVKLPDEFPSDLIPLLGDAELEHTLKNDDNKALNITYSTGNSREDAFAFYQEVMKDGQSVQEIVTEDSHILIGRLGDHVVAITIITDKSTTLVNIDTRPEQ